MKQVSLAFATVVIVSTSALAADFTKIPSPAARAITATGERPHDMSSRARTMVEDGQHPQKLPSSEVPAEASQ